MGVRARPLDIAQLHGEMAAELAADFGLDSHGLTHLDRVYWNLPTAALYEELYALLDARRAELDIANTLFGGRFTSLLVDEMRTKAGLTYSAYARFVERSVAGPFFIALRPNGLAAITP